MSFSEKLVQIKLTGAVVIDGIIHRAGTLVEMVEDEAKNLLRLGKAELHAVLGDDAADDTAAQAAAAQAAADAAQAAAVAEAKRAKPADTKGR